VRPDPVFSGDVLKAAALFVVAIAIGAAAIGVATGSIAVHLPDINLPDGDTATTTNLTDTSLSDTTINGPEPAAEVDPVEPAPGAPATAAAANPFSGPSLAEAVRRVLAETGPRGEVTRAFINEVQTQFVVRTGGKNVKAYEVLTTGDLVTQDASVTISGTATIDDFAFKIAAIKPAAVDRMLARAKHLSGAADFRPSVLSLERDLSGGLKPPEWTINAEGRRRYLTFKADLNGSHVRNVGGKGVEIPQAALDARKLNDCIQGAGEDFDQIQACFDEFSP
jgi:hypothetical protein